MKPILCPTVKDGHECPAKGRVLLQQYAGSHVHAYASSTLQVFIDTFMAQYCKPSIAQLEERGTVMVT